MGRRLLCSVAVPIAAVEFSLCRTGLRLFPLIPPLPITQQYLLPKKLLTALMGKLAAARMGGLTTAVIRRFVAHYKVNMGEAADPRIESYASFNDFFTRPLREGARPI